jgi:YidC/Oxa1 family membrane protein insertase
VARRATPPGVTAAGSAAPGSTAAAAAAPAGRAASLVGWVIPFASLVTAAIVPLAAGLYLLTTTAWTLGERTVLRRRFISLTKNPPAPRPVSRVWRRPGRQRR